MTIWVDVVARARGLRTHRIRPARLTTLRAVADLRELGGELAREGFAVAEGEQRPEALELAVRRRAAAELRVLARWCGSRAALLPVIFEDEDRRSLRAILRGSLQRQSPESRLHGLVPTPTLPERALREAAAAATPGAVATLLTLWNHPFAAGLRAPASAVAPDPLALDLALDHAWAARAVSGASRGGPEVSRFVGDAIDLMNAATVLARTGQVELGSACRRSPRCWRGTAAPRCRLWPTCSEGRPMGPRFVARGPGAWRTPCSPRASRSSTTRRAGRP